MAHQSTTFHFDSLSAAAAGLLTVLLDARTSDVFYSFGDLSAQQVLVSGLRIEGEIQIVADKVEKVSGAVRYDD